MRSILLFLFLGCFQIVNAQSDTAIINPNILLPKDSIERKSLILSLNQFLKATEQPNESNKWIFEPEKLETFILLDEFSGIQKNNKLKDDHFYKPYVTNLVRVSDDQYLIQLSYIGLNESVPLLRANFTIIAHHVGDVYVFASPLIRNTRSWKSELLGNNQIHYRQTIDRSKAKEFKELTITFDRKLGVVNKSTDFYCCEDLIELQRLIGVDYKGDYNGRAESVWSSSLGDRKLIMLGNRNAEFTNMDSHDLFHDRLSLVTSRGKLYRPIDEACAYLYGGSWGFTWKEIFQAFKEQIAANKNTDWIALKETPVYFKTKTFLNSSDYIVDALLVKKIEKEKGFDAIWELLKIGPAEKGNEKFYQTLEKLTGISKANYNQKVWELIGRE